MPKIKESIPSKIKLISSQLLKNIVKSPLDIIKALLRLASAIGPKIKPSRTGTTPNFSFYKK